MDTVSPFSLRRTMSLPSEDFHHFGVTPNMLDMSSASYCEMEGSATAPGAMDGSSVQFPLELPAHYQSAPMSPRASPNDETDYFSQTATESRAFKKDYNLDYSMHTPLRGRSRALSGVSVYTACSCDEDHQHHPHHFDDCAEQHSLSSAGGLVTPLSNATPRSMSWASGKPEYMTPMAGRTVPSPLTTPLDTPLATPLATPMAMGDDFDGVNPFYCPPSFMRGASVSGASGSAGAAGSLGHSHISALGLHGSMSTPSLPATLTKAEYSSAVSSAAAVAAAAAAAAAAVTSYEDERSPAESTHNMLASPMHHYHVDTQPDHFVGSGIGKKRRDSALTDPEVHDMSQESPDKPYGCKQCTKSFRRMEHLRRHIKIHTMERPYACQIAGCKRQFSRSDNLKAHMKTHAKRNGRNIYVEGIAETNKPTKKRKKSVKV